MKWTRTRTRLLRAPLGLAYRDEGGGGLAEARLATTTLAVTVAAEDRQSFALTRIPTRPHDSHEPGVGLDESLRLCRECSCGCNHHVEVRKRHRIWSGCVRKKVVAAICCEVILGELTC